jgi:hypothetical protein
MAASSSTSTAPWDEYKYFKEFTRLVAVKKREATTDKGVWLWDFMHNTLRLSETILVSPYDTDTLILATGDYLTDLFFICSTLRFSAGGTHQRNPEYTFENNVMTASKLMQTTRWFIYHYKAYYQGRWKRILAKRDMMEISQKLCQIAMGICKADDLHDLLRTRIQRGLSHCKLHRERTRHILQNSELTAMLTHSTIHPITYDLPKTRVNCPQISRFLTACGVDMTQKHVTLSQITERVHATLTAFTAARHRTVKETTDMLVKQIFTTEQMIDLSDHKCLWWPIGKWLSVESYEEQFNSKYPDAYRLYATGENPALPTHQPTNQGWEQQTTENAENEDWRTHKMEHSENPFFSDPNTDQPSELERELQSLNGLEPNAVPTDVMDFLNISDDQKTLNTNIPGENPGLPFEEVIFYSDSE